MKEKMNKQLSISQYCHPIVRGKEVIVCHTGNGKSVRLPLECWDVVTEYVDKYAPQEICDAACEEDREYYQQLFGELIDAFLLVGPEDENLKEIHLSITNRCNLRCTHCCEAALGMCGEDALNTRDWFDIVDKACDAKVDRIIVTGGEPLVRKDFMEITDYIKNRFDGDLGLMTNGLLITEKNVDQIVASYSDISISVDGYDEETCSKLRGVGVFDKVMKALNLLIEHGFPKEYLSLSMVETTITQGQTERFEKLCESLGVKAMVREYSATGRGAENSAWLEIKKEHPKKRIEGMDTIPKDVAVKRPFCQNCKAGRTQLAINYCGDIYPCMALEDPNFCFGNIKDVEDINAFLKNHSNMSDGRRNFYNLLAKNRNKCSGCEVAPFCMYCLAEFKLEVEKYGLDAICDVNKEYLSEVIWNR